jgi:hypothetical protein
MRKAIFCISILIVSVGTLSLISCTERADRNENDSPKGYNLDKPVKYNMPDELLEISGITFNNGKNDSLYAEQDEEGKVFYFKLGDKQVKYSRFGKKGDYEDIAIGHNQVIMLRSDGVLFTFPFNRVRSKEITDVQKLEGLLPAGEYEGMYADEKSGLLYILCKHCTDDHTTKSSSGYIFALQADGTLKQSGDFSINVKSIEKILGKKRIGFHPSAIAKNVNTNEWYILSSVNKMLVVTDINWNVKTVYPLNTSLFGQPEGMAFDTDYNLYISNEGSKTSEGNVLKFKYTK